MAHTASLLMLRPHRLTTRDDVPSEYVRLEAQIASATTSDEATSQTSSGPLVLVAESDPDVRDWVTRGLAEHGTRDAPAFRVEAVATAARLAECLQREEPVVVLCGHLAPPADWDSVLGRLRAGPPAWCVLVEHTAAAPTDALREPGQTGRLGEAVARLLHRTPGPSPSASGLPTVH